MKFADEAVPYRSLTTTIKDELYEPPKPPTPLPPDTIERIRRLRDMRTPDLRVPEQQPRGRLRPITVPQTMQFGEPELPDLYQRRMTSAPVLQNPGAQLALSDLQDPQAYGFASDREARWATRFGTPQQQTMAQEYFDAIDKGLVADIGRDLGQVKRALSTEIPGMQRVRQAVGRVAEPVAELAVEQTPGLKIAQEIGERVPRVPTPQGVAVGAAEAAIPVQAWEALLELVPGVGTVPGASSALRKALAEAGQPLTVAGVRAFLKQGGPDAVSAIMRATASESGALRFGKTPEERRILDTAAEFRKGDIERQAIRGQMEQRVSDLGDQPIRPAQTLEAPASEAASRLPGQPPAVGGGPPEPPVTTAVGPPENFDGDVLMLTETIRKSKRLRPEQQRAFAAERKVRAGKVGGILEGGRGDEAFQRAQGSLKGEFEGHATFEPPDIPEPRRLRMVEEIRTTDKIRPFEKLNAKQAFDKVMSGRLPEPAELEKLERVFGAEFSQAVLDKAPTSWLETIVDIATLPKSALTTLDLSFPLRQGIVLAPSQPRAWFKSWKPMIKAFASGKNARVIDDAIRADPLFGRFADSGGYTTPLTRAGVRAQREESLVSRFVDVIPGIRNSARAFVTFGNKLRFEAWKNLVKGFDEAEGLDAIDAGFARFVNHATGRGDVPFRAGEVLPGLSAFFSLRNFVSRFQLLADPALVRGVPMQVRAKMALDIGKFFGAGITFLGLLKLAHDRGVPGFEDVSVEVDPRSVDFGKLRIGDRRYDMWGGYQPLARYSAQIAKGERLAELPDDSKAIVPIDRKRYALRFMESKLDPTLGLAVALWRGENFLGQPLKADKETLRREAWDRAVPLFLQDLAESMRKYGPAGAVFALPGAFGTSIQDYETNEEQKQYAMKQVLPARLEAQGFPSVERGFQSEYWKSRLPSGTVDPHAFETWQDYRTAYIEHWAAQRPENISEAMARDLSARKFDSLDAVKEFEKQRNKAELQFWMDHPDLLQIAIDANLEDVSKEKLEILEEAIPR